MTAPLDAANHFGDVTDMVGAAALEGQGEHKMGDVVDLSVITKLDIPVEKVLSKALEEGLGTILVLGMYPEGRGFYFASSTPDGGTALWLMEMARKHLMDIADDSYGAGGR